MPTYRRIPIEVEAVQWFKNGDHPNDGPADSEGRVVRYYRVPYSPPNWKCTSCGQRMKAHGWIDQPEDSRNDNVVCPGDWVVTGNHGIYHVYNNTDFHTHYESVE